MKENEFQGKLIKEIKDIFKDDVLVLKNDPNYIQGIPDLTILNKKTCKWAFLEVKKSEKESKRPNQDFYISNNGKAYASFVYPENKDEVLNELLQSLKS